jgi:hypothetical protein
MPIDPSQAAIPVTPNLPGSSASPALRADASATGASKFGPDYILDDSLKAPAPPPPAGTVPFVPPPEKTSAGQTLASLPPLEPLGTASLTELSLQNQMLAPTHAPFKSEDAS